jgi:hypothetical protein
MFLAATSGEAFGVVAAAREASDVVARSGGGFLNVALRAPSVSKPTSRPRLRITTRQHVSTRVKSTTLRCRGIRFVALGARSATRRNGYPGTATALKLSESDQGISFAALRARSAARRDAKKRIHRHRQIDKGLQQRKSDRGYPGIVVFPEERA